MKVIIDTDMLIDDWLSILYLMAVPNLEIIAITIPGTGGGYINPSCHNAKALLKIKELDKTVPVCPGLTKPLIYSYAYPPTIREHARNFMGIDIPASDAPIDQRDITTFYKDILSNQTAPVTILSIGGGSNLGYILSNLKNDPCLSKISRIFIMGGAINVPGNISTLSDYYPFNKVAEWNVFVDVKGMAQVLACGFPVTIIPLDACNDVFLQKSLITSFKQKTSGSIAALIIKMLEIYIGSSTDPINIYDPLSSVVLANYNQIDKICKNSTVNLAIEQETNLSGETDNVGQTHIDSKGHFVQACLGAVQKSFDDFYIAPFLKK